MIYGNCGNLIPMYFMSHAYTYSIVIILTIPYFNTLHLVTIHKIVQNMPYSTWQMIVRQQSLKKFFQVFVDQVRIKLKIFLAHFIKETLNFVFYPIQSFFLVERYFPFQIHQSEMSCLIIQGILLMVWHLYHHIPFQHERYLKVILLELSHKVVNFFRLHNLTKIQIRTECRMVEPKRKLLPITLIQILFKVCLSFCISQVTLSTNCFLIKCRIVAASFTSNGPTENLVVFVITLLAFISAVLCSLTPCTCEQFHRTFMAKDAKRSFGETHCV